MDPRSCSGTLRWRLIRSTTESMVVNGTTFMRILDGDVVFNDGCRLRLLRAFANFARWPPRSSGHVLGLVIDRPPRDDVCGAHFDGRGRRSSGRPGALRSIIRAGLTPRLQHACNGATVRIHTVGLNRQPAGRPSPIRSARRRIVSSSASFSWNTAAVANGVNAVGHGHRTPARARPREHPVTVSTAAAGSCALHHPASSGATVSGVLARDVGRGQKALPTRSP